MIVSLGGELPQLRLQQFQLRHGQALAALDRLTEALEAFERARATLEGSSDPLHIVGRGRLKLELGRAHAKLGQMDAAERELRGAIADFERVLTPRNCELAHTPATLGELELERRRFNEARLSAAGLDARGTGPRGESRRPGCAGLIRSSCRPWAESRWVGSTPAVGPLRAALPGARSASSP